MKKVLAATPTQKLVPTGVFSIVKNDQLSGVLSSKKILHFSCTVSVPLGNCGNGFSRKSTYNSHSQQTKALNNSKILVFGSLDICRKLQVSTKSCGHICQKRFGLGEVTFKFPRVFILLIFKHTHTKFKAISTKQFLQSFCPYPVREAEQTYLDFLNYDPLFGLLWFTLFGTLHAQHNIHFLQI